MARVFLFILFLSSFTQAKPLGDPELGKIKAPSCVFCHGTTGQAVNPSYPHLAGQDATYLYQSMKDYQDGHRQGPLADMMKAQLSRLNDNDLRDIAAYFASQK